MSISDITELFPFPPQLAERTRRPCRSLSGGEHQIWAWARALISDWSAPYRDNERGLVAPDGEQQSPTECNIAARSTGRRPSSLGATLHLWPLETADRALVLLVLAPLFSKTPANAEKRAGAAVKAAYLCAGVPMRVLPSIRGPIHSSIGWRPDLFRGFQNGPH